MKVSKTAASTPAASVEEAAKQASSAPIQKEISNWERDLVTRRTAERKDREARTSTLHGFTILSALMGVGALLLGQPVLGVAILGTGILLSPGDPPDIRNDRDR